MPSHYCLEIYRGIHKSPALSQPRENQKPKNAAPAELSVQLMAWKGASGNGGKSRFLVAALLGMTGGE